MRAKAFLVAAAMILSFASQAQQKDWAVVKISSCFLRAKPDYESGNESQCLMGTVVKVTGSDRYWRRIDAPDYSAVWTNDLALAYMSEDEKDAYVAAPKWICVKEYSYVYSAPDAAARRISDLTMGSLLRRVSADLELQGSWAEVLTADGQRGWVPAADLAPYEDWLSGLRAPFESGLTEDERLALEQRLVETARLFLGTPYMWGGNTVKHFDCSGLTKFVYLMNGITLPRNAREQIGLGKEIPFDFSQMRPGDLIFFGRKATADRKMAVTHVAMYTGDGRIIHSSQLVRENSLRPGDPDYYQGREILGVRRMIGEVPAEQVWWH